jgi:hypothetical protein
MFDFPKYPLEALFASEQQPGRLDPTPRMLPILQGADVIFGRDVMSSNQFLVFGRDLLQSIVRSGMARPVKGLVIEIDQGRDSDELEKLISVIRIVKGHDDYQASETFSEDEAAGE